MVKILIKPTQSLINSSRETMEMIIFRPRTLSPHSLPVLYNFMVFLPESFVRVQYILVTEQMAIAQH